MSKPEAKVEDYLVQGVANRGGWAAKMVDKGRRGAPDRELRFQKGLTIYAETKAKKGVLKPWQGEYHTALRALGYTVLVLWTIDQVDEFFWRFDRGCYALENQALKAALRDGMKLVRHMKPFGSDNVQRYDVDPWLNRMNALLTASETPVNPTMQHHPGCPALRGQECQCDPTPLKIASEPK